jgi:hypothetical protein
MSWIRCAIHTSIFFDDNVRCCRPLKAGDEEKVISFIQRVQADMRKEEQVWSIHIRDEEQVWSILEGVAVWSI